MSLKIHHGVFKNYTGSCSISSNLELVTTTVQGPTDSTRRDSKYDELSIEIRVKHFPHLKVFESMAVGIINRILSKFVVKDSNKLRSMTVTVYTNTTNMSMICNSVLVACLDGGIPLKEMFYCAGNEELFVFSSGNVTLYHGKGMIDEEKSNEIKRELEYIKELVEHSMKDVFSI